MALPNIPQVRVPFDFGVLRTIEQKVADLLNTKDGGAISDGATNATAAINTILAELGTLSYAVQLVIPPNTIYTESSLSIPSNVTVVSQTVNGTIKYIVADRGAALPVTNGGLEIKSAGITGVLIRNHDAGTAADPFLEFLNSSTGQRASFKSLNEAVAGYKDIKEIASPGAPAADTGRLFCRDNGAGKTQLCVRFNTGAIQVIATEP